MVEPTQMMLPEIKLEFSTVPHTAYCTRTTWTIFKKWNQGQSLQEFSLFIYNRCLMIDTSLVKYDRKNFELIAGWNLLFCVIKFRNVQFWRMYPITWNGWHNPWHVAHKNQHVIWWYDTIRWDVPCNIITFIVILCTGRLKSRIQPPWLCDVTY